MSQGYNSCLSAADLADGANIWITSNSPPPANAVSAPSGGISNTLEFTMVGNAFTLPGDCYGVEVELTWAVDNGFFPPGSATDVTIELCSGGTVISSNKGSGAALPTGTPTPIVFGSISDTWGAGASIAASLVNASDFGARIQVNTASPNDTVTISEVRIKLYEFSDQTSTTINLAGSAASRSGAAGGYYFLMGGQMISRSASIASIDTARELAVSCASRSDSIASETISRELTSESLCIGRSGGLGWNLAIEFCGSMISASAAGTRSITLDVQNLAGGMVSRSVGRADEFVNYLTLAGSAASRSVAFLSSQAIVVHLAGSMKSSSAAVALVSAPFDKLVIMKGAAASRSVVRGAETISRELKSKSQSASASLAGETLARELASKTIESGESIANLNVLRQLNSETVCQSRSSAVVNIRINLASKMICASSIYGRETITRQLTSKAISRSVNIANPEMLQVRYGAMRSQSASRASETIARQFASKAIAKSEATGIVGVTRLLVGAASSRSSSHASTATKVTLAGMMISRSSLSGVSETTKRLAGTMLCIGSSPASIEVKRELF